MSLKSRLYSDLVYSIQTFTFFFHISTFKFGNFCFSFPKKDAIGWLPSISKDTDLIHHHTIEIYVIKQFDYMTYEVIGIGQ